MKSLAEWTLGPRTRTIGFVYLLYFVAAFSASFLMKGIVVSGNAAAISNGILAHENLYRTGLSAGLIANALYITVTALFYGLFAQVNRSVSLIAAFISLAGCTVQIIGGIFQLAPLVLLTNSQLLSGLTIEQLQAASLLSLKLYIESFHVSLVLFAVYDLLLGYLVYKSMFLPKPLGALLVLAGLGWLCFAWPPLAISMSSYILPLGALAELLLMLWLLIRNPVASPDSVSNAHLQSSVTQPKASDA